MLSFFSMLYVFCAFGQISPAALEMTNAANTFISPLSPELKTKVLLPFSSPERTRWSNEPSSMFRRVGISVEELNDNQKIAMQALVRTGWDHFHFIWMGSVQRGNPIYYAIQAPGFIIEYISRLGDVHHIHTLMRDLKHDF